MLKCVRLAAVAFVVAPVSSVEAQFHLAPDSEVRAILEQQVTAKHKVGIVVGVIVLTNTNISADDIGFHLIDPAVPLAKPQVERKEIAVDAASLAQYAGVYQLAPQFALTVTVENGGLWVLATGQPKFHLFASAPDEFFLKVVDAQLTFVKDPSGAVTSLVLHQNGANQTAKKLP